jgi:YD repeat-containing protein
VDETTFHNGTTALSVYDALGRTLGTRDQSNHWKKMRYDARGNLQMVIQSARSEPTWDGSAATDIITTFTYDELGHKLTQQDANGHITRFAYDERGRTIWRQCPTVKRSA